MGIENIAETRLDEEDRFNPAETMLNEEQENPDNSAGGHCGSRAFLNPGQTIASDYVVINRLGNDGSQAAVYAARREGKQFAIKIYDRGFRPPEDFAKALKGHTCPYVAKLIDYGYQGENYYEVYEYYGNGTLEDRGKCTLTFIKDVIIPNMNEGLHFLHTLSGIGIVHGDIKPSNIFISNDESHVLIGDFGISSYLDKSGKIIGDMKGTPEYAPRTRSFFGKVTRSPAYDYGSFGLVLIKLATGHSLFEGLDVEGITRTWEEGIRIPEFVDSRLKRLIAGLLIEDEQKRFGYEEVKKWCEGELVRVIENSLYDEEDFETPEDPDPLFFGIFDDRIVTVGTLRELSNAMAANWEHTKRQMKCAPFYEFIRQFDHDLEKEIKEYSKLPNEDHAVFKALYRIFPTQNLVYKGVDYGNARDFVNSLSEGSTADAREIIKAGLFEFFLKQNGYNADLIQQVHRIAAMDSHDPKFVPQMLYYLFNKQKEYHVNGKTVTSPDALIDEIVKMNIEDVERLTDDSKFMAWLYSMGYRDDVMHFFES